MSASCLGIGIRVDRAVRVHEHALLQNHQEEARRRRDAGREADRHHARFDDPSGRGRGPGDHRLRVARFHHQPGVEERLRCEPARNAGGRVGPPFAIERRIAVEARARLRALEQYRLGELLIAQALRRRDDALVGRFRKHDPHAAAANPLETVFEHPHRVLPASPRRAGKTAAARSWSRAT